MYPSKVDYSLYLVTDSTDAILGSRDLVTAVEEALKGGVTIVQYRDKVSDTAILVSTARRLHAVTRKYNVPLLINDRVDVALAIGCEGVHIGQDDLDLTSARKLLGDAAIIGVSVNTIEEAQKASAGGASYLGIGAVFATSTKKDTKGIIGTAGTQAILEAIAPDKIPTVCIGGINTTTAQRVLYQSACREKKLDGVAVVSVIMGADDPRKATEELKTLIQTPPPFAISSFRNRSESINISDVLVRQNFVTSVVKAVGEKNPLSHNMTNLVVQNFAANVALAIGASPIMSSYGKEAEDLAKLGGSLVINMGTVTPEGLENYITALKLYNLAGGPVVFDPVGAGATAIRRNTVKSLMAAGYFDVIKGNECEIKTVAGVAASQRGVDSGTSTLSTEEKASLVQGLASREHNIVLMTGATDLISDGERTFAIKNGHKLLGRITGSGCVLGTILSAMLAVERTHRLAAAISGLLMYEIAAEIAVERVGVRGPGTFIPALIDALDQIRQDCADGETTWLHRANIEEVTGL